MRAILTMCIVVSVAIPLLAQETDKIDASVLRRIRAEAFEHGAIMENAFYLTDVYGSRLTGSTSFNAAADWARNRFQSYGLADVRLQRFPWGADWSYSRFQAHLLKPQYGALEALPMVYSAGTPGPIAAEVLLATAADLDRADEKSFDLLARELKGRVRRRYVMLQRPARVPTPVAAPSRRLDEADLTALANAPPPAPPRPAPPSGYRGMNERLQEFLQFLKDEGAAGVLWRSGGLGQVSTYSLSTAYRDKPALLPVVYLAGEHYNRMGRLLEQNVPVEVEINLDVTRSPSPVDGVNVIGEIPGNRKRDEVVMVGAHLDSWVGGTGATDNAAGCAVVLEVARILTALNLNIDRTVRFALWGGEEGGGLGAHTYVREHYGDLQEPKPEHAKFSAYFNLDNGTGKIRGVYTAGDIEAGAMFRAWFTALGDPGVSTVSAKQATGVLGSDDMAFTAAGLPAFAFIQDPLDYSRTHHTTMDTYDRLESEDLQQAAIVMTSFVYAAATRGEMVARKK